MYRGKWDQILWACSGFYGSGSLMRYNLRQLGFSVEYFKWESLMTQRQIMFVRQWRGRYLDRSCSRQVFLLTPADGSLQARRWVAQLKSRDHLLTSIGENFKCIFLHLTYYFSEFYENLLNQFLILNHPCIPGERTN